MLDTQGIHYAASMPVGKRQLKGPRMYVYCHHVSLAWSPGVAVLSCLWVRLGLALCWLSTEHHQLSNITSAFALLSPRCKGTLRHLDVPFPRGPPQGTQVPSLSPASNLLSCVCANLAAWSTHCLPFPNHSGASVTSGSSKKPTWWLLRPLVVYLISPSSRPCVTLSSKVCLPWCEAEDLIYKCFTLN